MPLLAHENEQREIVYEKGIDEEHEREIWVDERVDDVAKR